jgi:DNA-binding MarR family transcriptional regulator
LRPAAHDLEPWVNFLRAHAATTRRLNAELVANHGLTINDYEVLLHLARAPDEGLKRVELVDRLLLTPSGITRLLSGLESAGYVERAACSTDARVVYARITEAGLAKLREARETHLVGIHALFLDRFSAEEQRTLASLLERLPLDGTDLACAPD